MPRMVGIDPQKVVSGRPLCEGDAFALWHGAKIDGEARKSALVRLNGRSLQMPRLSTTLTP